MRFDIPKVMKFLPLQEYAPEEPSLAGVGLQVWVDPPRSVLMEFDNLNRDYRAVLERLMKAAGKEPEKKLSAGERLLGWLQARARNAADEKFKSETESYRRGLYGWYARLWSQAPDIETHWTVAELEAISDKNPHFYEWLCASSWALIEAHRDEIKKGWRGPSAKLPGAGEPATPS